MTELEILEETIDFYSSDTSRRSYDEDDNLCMYFDGETKNMCAVGRCLMDPKAFQDINGSIDIAQLTAEELDRLLKPEYRGHAMSFWQELQGLHDVARNWGINELTEGGERFVKRLIDQIHKRKDDVNKS